VIGGAVVHVVPEFWPVISGTGRQTARQAGALAARGQTSWVVTRRLQTDWPRRDDQDGADVFRVGVPGRGRLADKASVLAVGWWLLRRRRRIGVVHLDSYADYAIAASAAGLLARTVVIWDSEGEATEVAGPAVPPARRLQRRLRRWILGRCWHVGLTQDIVGELARVGIPPTRTRLVPVPIDTSWFRPATASERTEARKALGFSETAVVVLYSGQLRRLKRIDRLIDAVGSLSGELPGLRLVVLGGVRGAEDDCAEELQTRVQELGLSDVVHLAGAVADVRPYLWAADIFALASQREGMPNSLAEAMACGLACMAPLSAGGQLLHDGAGLVAASAEVTDLADVLRRAATDPSLRRACGAAAVARAREWSTDSVSDAYAQLHSAMGVGR
jgi:glycosyltransferase involved in cell wall biosynthesis